MRRAPDLLLSFPVLIGLSLPLALGTIFMVYGMGFSPVVAAQTTVFKVYYALLLGVLAGRAILSFRAGDRGTALIAMGLFIALLQATYVYGYRLTGRIGIGLDEEVVPYQSVEAGPWRSLDPIPLVLKEARPGTGEPCTVLLDGREKKLSKGDIFRWRDLEVTLEDIAAAPFFLLDNRQGYEVETGYMKLRLGEAGEDVFQFQMTPHRFYVSLPERKHEHWKKAGDKWIRSMEPDPGAREKAEGEAYRLLVMRGKLALADQVIHPNERVFFDGYSVRFEPGAPWIDLSVKKVFHKYFLYAGAVFFAAGCLMARLGRRKA